MSSRLAGLEKKLVFSRKIKRKKINHVEKKNKNSLFTPIVLVFFCTKKNTMPSVLIVGGNSGSSFLVMRFAKVNDESVEEILEKNKYKTITWDTAGLPFLKTQILDLLSSSSESSNIARQVTLLSKYDQQIDLERPRVGRIMIHKPDEESLSLEKQKQETLAITHRKKQDTRHQEARTLRSKEKFSRFPRASKNPRRTNNFR